MKNYAYLINVNANANNNKFYEITLNDDNSIDVSYGRVGGTPMSHHYTPCEKDFYSLINDKTRKGYEDRTALHSEVSKGSNSVAAELSYEPVADKEVQEVLDLLVSSSREFMQKNYTVTAAEITPKMIEEAENDLDWLNKIARDASTTPNALYAFNKKLQELFTDIPRAMKRVDENLAQTEQDFVKIIEKEREMLDNVRGAVSVDKEVSATKGKGTLLDACGLTMRPVTYKEEDQIVAHLGYDYDDRKTENRFVKAFAVENNATRQAYENYKKENHMTSRDVRLFYHGSKVENWYSIMKMGLSLNPNASTTGKMFGQGLYFAPELRKALNYMDVKGSHWNDGNRQTGYTAVYSVALGKCYQPDYVLGSSFRGKDLPKGTSSVCVKKDTLLADHKGGRPCHKLRNDEYIVFDQAACTIKYLMEMSSQNVRTKEYRLDRDVLKNQLSSGFDTLVKTPNGVKGEVFVEQLPSAVQAELESKITKDYDYKHLYVDYNAKTDRISLDIITYGGDSAAIQPNITRDDYAFLAREMKKSYAESENDWKAILNDVKDYPVGKEAVNKNGVIPLTEEKAKNKEKE